MSVLAVKWYDYAGQEEMWQAFWAALIPFLPLKDPVFYAGASADLWVRGDYSMTWACGGDVALTPGGFTPIAIPCMTDSNAIYCSHIIKRPGIPLDKVRVGINQTHSQSGHFSLARWWFRNNLPLPSVILTGGHEASVKALLQGKVDLIAVDSQGFNLMQAAYPSLMDMVHVDDTDSQLAPPLCLPGENFGYFDAAPWREGLNRFLKENPVSVVPLGINGFRPVCEKEYESLAETLKNQMTKGQVLIRPSI